MIHEFLELLQLREAMKEWAARGKKMRYETEKFREWLGKIDHVITEMAIVIMDDFLSSYPDRNIPKRNERDH